MHNLYVSILADWKWLCQLHWCSLLSPECGSVKRYWYQCEEGPAKGQFLKSERVGKLLCRQQLNKTLRIVVLLFPRENETGVCVKILIKKDWPTQLWSLRNLRISVSKQKTQERWGAIPVWVQRPENQKADGISSRPKSCKLKPKKSCISPGPKGRKDQCPSLVEQEKFPLTLPFCSI